MADTVTNRAPAPGDDWIDWRTPFVEHKGLIVGMLIATIVTAYVVVRFVLPELYEVRASVLVKVGRENTELPATVQKGSLVSGGVRREELNSEIHMLTAPSLLSAVIDELGPEAFGGRPPAPRSGWRALIDRGVAAVRSIPAHIESLLISLGLRNALSDRDKLRLALERALKVDVEFDSQVIGIKLRLPDPDLAVRVLDRLLQRYLDHHIEVWRSVNARDFFASQVETRRKQVQDLERAREAVKSKWNLVAAADQRALILRQADTVRIDIATNATRQAALQAQEQAMRARLEALPEELQQSQNVAPNPLIQYRKERLTTLEQERARRMTVYDRQSEPMKNIDKEIGLLQELLAKESPTVVSQVTMQANPIKAAFRKSIEELRVESTALDSTARELKSRADILEARLRDINTGERQLRELDREYQIAEEAYVAYGKRMEEGRVSEELDQRRVANIALVSAPVRPIEPVYPRKMLVMVLSVPIGVLLGIALALFAAHTSTVVASPRDVAGAGVPYLGTVRV